jgi:hypothetical protein
MCATPKQIDGKIDAGSIVIVGAPASWNCGSMRKLERTDDSDEVMIVGESSESEEE